MKHIKTFEDIKLDNMKVGDYVLTDTFLNIFSLKSFLKNTVGEVVDIDPNFIMIKYENIPYDVSTHFNEHNIRTFDKSLILDFSENEEDLKIKIAANKYNI
jgi:hypothetical protein